MYIILKLYVIFEIKYCPNRNKRWGTYSRLLIFEVGYLEFCDTRSIYLNQKYILFAFSNHTFALETFYKSNLSEVQIELVKNSPHNFERSRVDCTYIE